MLHSFFFSFTSFAHTFVFFIFSMGSLLALVVLVLVALFLSAARGSLVLSNGVECRAAQISLAPLAPSMLDPLSLNITLLNGAQLIAAGQLLNYRTTPRAALSGQIAVPPRAPSILHLPRVSSSL